MTTATKEISVGYKQTEIGVIPEDWDVKKIEDITSIDPDNLGSNTNPNYSFKYIALEDVNVGILKNYSEKVFCTAPSRARRKIKKGDVLFGTVRPNLKSHLFFNEDGGNWICSTGFAVVRCREDVSSPIYIFEHFLAHTINHQIDALLTGSNYPAVNSREVKNLMIQVPGYLEQSIIATVLSDTEKLIEKLEKLIEKKKNIRLGAMQELLTGKRRLPGFSGEWWIKTIEETTECLDNLRVPLNENQRSKMQGDIPYCGANGVLDYVNNYVIDDDIILIAEDGGYFDEYSYRPIAYRMIGKCWVNNHAHILKAKNSYAQGFIYYSLVHKNILKFLASGTRAKLNKSEMYKIEIDIAPTKSEQSAIATVLSNMDVEIQKLKSQFAKYKNLKQGMMQKLLTGKIRLLKK